MTCRRAFEDSPHIIIRAIVDEISFDNLYSSNFRYFHS